MAEIPVGKSEEEEKTERAVDAFKKGGGRKREEVTDKARKYLDEINANLKKGLVYITEDDEIIDVPERAMVLMLAGKTLTVGKPPEDKPVVVTKGPPIEGSAK